MARGWRTGWARRGGRRSSRRRVPLRCETRNHQPEMPHPKPEMRNANPRTRTSKPEMRNRKREVITPQSVAVVADWGAAGGRAREQGRRGSARDPLLLTGIGPPQGRSSQDGCAAAERSAAAMAWNGVYSTSLCLDRAASARAGFLFDSVLNGVGYARLGIDRPVSGQALFRIRGPAMGSSCWARVLTFVRVELEDTPSISPQSLGGYE